ncbi:PREDICTED: uncharacterized protein LOC106110225 [Papilio polytes]|uniref:uncharacterized protein LOC106110225 n=1 Tax=Papilio polytes TaxID=76194 RepID=UPI00067675B6|nr:PREDICTED: uncharacterized protein LOC106110225 [Papilio polytes]
MVLNFENEFRLSTAALRFNGIHPDSHRDKKWLIQFSFFNSVCFIVVYFFAHSIIYHDINNSKFAEAIQNGSFVIVSLSIPYYNYLAIHHKEHFKKYFDTIDEYLSEIEQYKKEERELVLKYSKMASEFKFAQMFAITYPKWIESNRDNVYVFLCLFSLSFIFAIYATIVYVGFDPLISIFVLQICGQLEILSHQLLALNQLTDQNEIVQNLKTINIKLQGLYRYTR